MTKLIEDAIRAELSQPSSTGEDDVAYVVEPVDGHGLRPGVDLDDSAALLEIMEQR